MTTPTRQGQRKSTARKTGTSQPRTSSRASSSTRTKKSPGRFATELVGRVGELTLDYAKRDHRTIISHSYFTTPWKLLPPIYLDDTGAAYTLLVNPSGGLVGGDHLSIDMNVGQDAHVLISAPSANRVYRTEGKVSEQHVTITVGSGAVLEWFPEHTIPFAGSRFRQVLQATLAPGATLLLWDAVASGRIARGERWAFTDLGNDIRITTASGSTLLERYLLDPSTDLGRVGLAEEWNYVASLYVVNDATPPEVWTALESTIATILDTRPGEVLGGVSAGPVPGLAVKILARAAPDLTAILDALWAAVREGLWNLPPVSLRKY
ncbi:urease accessory protein UreD [Candidatus Nitrospira nitrificans]|uniref:Putative Urease accessory protein UreD n=1 Tax=Candidatus Nitrospira nitrificans TaxID=1742973 RepID=A0A0S4LSA4_9BACT|nr:urease accessory protein UreD [Candidatus Nitrospira nitrificans]CUS39838.1 putative Urease accessory protein UreD [Candidatus Nitrospira nitrificans]